MIFLNNKDLTMKSSELVPSQEHYTNNYLGKDSRRLHSYVEQIRYVLDAKPKNVLVIGRGDGFVSDLLERLGIPVMNLDIMPRLKPHIVGSVEAIPLADKSVDAVLCCQVLEHLEFQSFYKCMREIHRVTRKRLVLSLPDVRHFFSLCLSLPKCKVDWQFSMQKFGKRPIPKSRLTDHGHFWEIGFDGTPYKQIVASIESAGWKIARHRRVRDLPWHSFFLCDPS
jgi:hypothetical protein